MSINPATISRSTTRAIRPKAGERHNDRNDDLGTFGIGKVGAVDVSSAAGALSSSTEGRGVWPRCLVLSKVATCEAAVSTAGAGGGVRVGTAPMRSNGNVA